MVVDELRDSFESLRGARGAGILPGKRLADSFAWTMATIRIRRPGSCAGGEGSCRDSIGSALVWDRRRMARYDTTIVGRVGARARGSSRREKLMGLARTSLRVWLIAPTVVLLVAAVGASAGLLLRNHRQAVAQVTARLHQEVGSEIRRYLETHLDTARQVNGLNADLLRLERLDTVAAEDLSQQLWHQVQRFDEVAFVFVATPAGGAVGAGRNADGLLVVDSTDVDPERGAVAGTRWEFRADAEGRRGELLKATPEFDARARPWFAAAVESRESVWSDVYLFFAEGTAAIAAAEPIFDAAGELLGVTGVDLTLDQLSGFLADLWADERGFTFVVDQDGRLVATSTGMDRETSRDGRPIFAWQSFDPRLTTVASALRQERLAAASTAEVPRSLAIEGEPHFVDVVPLQLAGGLDWRIVTGVPEDAYLEGVFRGTRQTLAAVAVATVLALLGALAVARRILIPVHHLSAVSRGHREQRTALPGRRSGIRELDDMAESFHRMAAELDRSLRELEDRVAERTSELSIAKDEADRASEAKTRFLATFSHEIRTPLTAILGHADLLAYGGAGEAEIRESVEAIRGNGRQVHQLLSDLLDLHRIEAGRLQAEPSPFALEPLLSSLRSTFEALAGGKGLAFEVSLSGDLPWRLEGDEKRLRQILDNLLSNAVKYTDSGRVGLHIRCLDSPAPGGESAVLSFVVKDTGRGIDDKGRARLFRRFSRVDVDPDSPVEGFGLGLSIVKELVELLGGDLHLETEPGVGSTFELRLPVSGCRDWASEPAKPRSRSRRQRSGAWAPLSGRVLVVDDAEAMRQVCQRVLERWHLEVVSAASGEAALALVEAQEIDLILMDWHMPELDGLETTRRLRAGGDLTPVVALTAAAGADVRRTCLAAGCDEYLPKPLDLDALHLILKNWLPVTDATGPVDLADLEELTRAYLSGLPAEIVELRRAVEAGDWASFGARIHKLVGTSGSYGLSEVYREAERLETRGAERDVAAALQGLRALATAVEHEEKQP